MRWNILKQYTICVVIVTYGERYHLLERVLSSVDNEKNVQKIIIVNNGANLSLLDEKQYKTDIEIIHLECNTGSANGYNIGLKNARKSDCEFIFILDDDNVPETGCIENLIKYYRKFKEKKDDTFALLALREDRIDLKRVASGINPQNVFTLTNSFLGWHVKDIPKKFIQKINNKYKFIKRVKYVESVKIPFAPYGGLFFHKSLLDIIGYPNPEFYLYCDDYDFTYRLTANNKSIILIPSSRIIDIDKSWFVKEKHGFIMSFLKTDSDYRIFYSIRNRVFFETRNFIKNKYIYRINKTVLLIILFILSNLVRKKDRYKIILKAIRDGQNGHLGKEYWLDKEYSNAS